MIQTVILCGRRPWGKFVQRILRSVYPNKTCRKVKWFSCTTPPLTRPGGQYHAMPSHTASVVPLGGVSAVSSIGLLLQLLMFSPPVAFENTACSEPSPNSDITNAVYLLIEFVCGNRSDSYRRSSRHGAFLAKTPDRGRTLATPRQPRFFIALWLHRCLIVSLCRLRHDEQHRLGAEAFGRKHGMISGPWQPNSHAGARIGRWALL